MGQRCTSRSRTACPYARPLQRPSYAGTHRQGSHTSPETAAGRRLMELVRRNARKLLHDARHLRGPRHADQLRGRQGTRCRGQDARKGLGLPRQQGTRALRVLHQQEDPHHGQQQYTQLPLHQFACSRPQGEQEGQHHARSLSELHREERARPHHPRTHRGSLRTAYLRPHPECRRLPGVRCRIHHHKARHGSLLRYRPSLLFVARLSYSNPIGCYARHPSVVAYR